MVMVVDKSDICARLRVFTHWLQAEEVPQGIII